jgi:site-specific DNA-methyltransferase (adenine-specific)
MMEKQLLLGDCLDRLKELPDNSIDSVVTDAPYGLSFMGKKWDYDVPSTEIWKECFRVLKPGGHLLSFGGSRTYHRLAVNVEDAGFEIRDQIQWIYGSGFPKSHNIGKAVDKKLGNEREVVGIDVDFVRKNPNNTGINRLVTDENGVNKDNRKKQAVKNDNAGIITKGNSPYEGWGTALKPAHEPIVMARKPLSEKTVVDNVLEWGTGGINIDESRITYKDLDDRKSVDRSDRKVSMGWRTDDYVNGVGEHTLPPEQAKGNDEGRFPANIILSEEAAENLDQHTGISKSGIRKPTKRKEYNQVVYGKRGDVDTIRGFNDKGGASRYFYVVKPSKKEKDFGMGGVVGEKFRNGNYGNTRLCDTCGKTDNGTNNHIQCQGNFSYVEEKVDKRKNNHPTVKPIKLMEYLIKLVTPVGGTTLDPFMGSGTTGIAALTNGFNFVGIEMGEDYMDIAQQRIDAWTKEQQTKLDI